MDGIDILYMRIEQISAEAKTLKQEAIIVSQELYHTSEFLKNLKPEDLNDLTILVLASVMIYKKQTLMKERKALLEKLDKLENETDFIGAALDWE